MVSDLPGLANTGFAFCNKGHAQVKTVSEKTMNLLGGRMATCCSLRASSRKGPVGSSCQWAEIEAEGGGHRPARTPRLP